MKKYILLVCVWLVSASLQATDLYPTHWWVGMKNPSLQIILHRDRVGQERVSLLPYKGVRLVRQHRVDNPNYLFLDLQIAPGTRPGKLRFRIDNLQSPEAVSFKIIEYELKARNPGNGKTRIQGVTARDFIYLLMPDRFANGDPSNDFFPDMRDTGHSRQNPFDRHGGDLKGVEQHLDHIAELGCTALWMTPVVENDMARTQEGGTSRSTYHGYAFTNQYEIDRRLGGNAAYHQLIAACRQKGIKIIQDAVYNHVGQDHWSVRDLPMKDWLNQWPNYTNTSYKDQPLQDPYASAIDRETAISGWFTPFLVDLNQRNPFVRNFLIQYAIWATEEFGIDGWRVDTYFYSDPGFLNAVNAALYREFPKLTVFGETWVNSVVSSAYFCENTVTGFNFRHNSQGNTDFPVYFAILDMMNQPFGWNEGANRLYQVLAQDALYKDPMRHCLFVGNHDMNRFFSEVKENILKYKMGLNLLLTLRGIPQLYYGDEILMKNYKDPTDAEVRRDFPGGWAGDPVNKFRAAERTPAEQDVFNHVKALGQFRKNSPALASGRLMQYLPKDGLYIYFRYSDAQTVMVVCNTGEKTAQPDWNHYRERIGSFTGGRDIVTGETVSLQGLQLRPWESRVLELTR